MAVTSDKEIAFRAIINVWLKDKTRYCAQCGKLETEMVDGVCCEDQRVGTNWEVCQAIIRQNKDIRDTRSNDYASTKDKSLRFGVSIPPSLYYTLNSWKKGNNHKGLFDEKGEMEWFAKTFKQFAVCKRV